MRGVNLTWFASIIVRVLASDWHAASEERAPKAYVSVRLFSIFCVKHMVAPGSYRARQSASLWRGAGLHEQNMAYVVYGTTAVDGKSS